MHIYAIKREVADFDFRLFHCIDKWKEIRSCEEIPLIFGKYSAGYERYTRAEVMQKLQTYK